MNQTSGIESVAVVGAGLMGSGIAEAVAVAGLPVALRDVDEISVKRARGRIESPLARAVEGSKLDASHADVARGRIALTTELEQIAGADLVVEAVPEDEHLKLEVMAAIDSVVREDAIIASNTSSIFAEQIGKCPIETKDRSGFIVNMLLVPYLMAAVRMYEDGFASREDIDAGMKLGCGHPTGPLTLCDFIGLDVLYAVCDSLYEEFKRDEYAPPPLLKRMVASGRLGRKVGRGFYEYQ